MPTLPTYPAHVHVCTFIHCMYLYKEPDGIELSHCLSVLRGPGQQVQGTNTHLHHLIHVHSILHITHHVCTHVSYIVYKPQISHIHIRVYVYYVQYIKPYTTLNAYLYNIVYIIIKCTMYNVQCTCMCIHTKVVIIAIDQPLH